MVKDTIKINDNKFSKTLELKRKEENKGDKQEELESEKKVIEEEKQNEEDNREIGSKTKRRKTPKYLRKSSLLKMKTLNI